MVLMKAAMKRAKGGNPNPPKRQSFPETDQGKLDSKLDAYIRKVGIKESFNLYDYQNLQAQQAESSKSLFLLSELLSCLIEVSPTAQIKYKYLKMSLGTMMNRFGTELLAQHWDRERSLLAGACADCIGVILKHWRRATSSKESWQRLCDRLDESQVSVLTRLYKKTGGVQEEKKRTLQNNLSDVTMDSKGFPAMLADAESSSSEEENDKTKPHDDHMSIPASLNSSQ